MHRLRSCIFVCIAAVFAASLWLPVKAATAITLRPAQALTAGGKNGQYSPQIAVSSDGRMLVTWLSGEDGTPMVELGRLGGSWMRPQRLAAGGVPLVDAIGSNGPAAVAWIAGHSDSGRRAAILLSIAPSGRAFGAAKVIASGDWLSAPSGMVVRPNGQVVLDWLRSLSGHDGNPSELEYAVARASGAIHRGALEMSGRYGASIAETARGAVLLAYTTPLGFLPYGFNQQAAAAVMPVGSLNFGAPTEFEYDKTDPYGEATSVAAVSGPGGAVLQDAFRTRLEAGTEVRAVKDDGSFGSPRKLASGPNYTSLQFSDDSSRSRYSLAADGALVEAWEETRFKGEYDGPVAAEAVMAGVTRDGASAIARPQQIYSNEATAPGAPMVVSFGDTTVAMWTEAVSADSCKLRTFYAYRLSGGAFSGRLALSSPYGKRTSGCGIGEATIAAGGDHALAAWVANGAIDVRMLSG